LRPHEVAAQLAFGLSRRVKQFGRLKFPRLLLGLVVIRTAITPDDHAQALEELRGLVKSRRAFLAKVREILEVFGDVPDHRVRMVKRMALFLLDAIGALAWKVRSQRGPSFTWYRQVRGEDPLAALIDLNLREAEGTPEALAEVDQVLCDAFLADLRASFTTGLRARLRTGNCVALLDNADSRTGQEFLEVLIAVRHRHAEETSGDCDPLVVVATGRTRFPQARCRNDRGLAARDPNEATYADWAERLDDTPESWLYPVELGDLDDRELGFLARRWLKTANVDHIVEKVRRLTHGHLWGSALVLHAVTVAAERAGADAVDLRGISPGPIPTILTRRSPRVLRTGCCVICRSSCGAI
jgi:hypothetical protein